MSFGATAETFKVLAVAQGGEVYEVDAKKNEGTSFIEWLSAKKSSAGSASSSQSSPTGSAGPATNFTPTKSTYETPEERAKKQIYIVRQSSLSSAIGMLSVGAKTPPSLDEVMKTAQRFEGFVFGDGATKAATVEVPNTMKLNIEDIRDSEID